MACLRQALIVTLAFAGDTCGNHWRRLCGKRPLGRHGRGNTVPTMVAVGSNTILRGIPCSGCALCSCPCPAASDNESSSATCSGWTRTHWGCIHLLRDPNQWTERRGSRSPAARRATSAALSLYISVTSAIQWTDHRCFANPAATTGVVLTVPWVRTQL